MQVLKKPRRGAGAVTLHRLGFAGMERGAEELSRLLSISQILLERSHYLTTQVPGAFPFCSRFSSTHHEVCNLWPRLTGRMLPAGAAH